MPSARRPSPSMIVALTALVVALSGTAVAASRLINGDRLKRRSVPGDRIKKNALTGAEINESKLGTVPNAAHARFADSATRATHAASADSALGASDAAHATSADKLGGLAPSAFVQGGGQTFAGSKTMALNTASGPVVDVPLLGTLTASCNGGVQTLTSLTNSTAQTVDDSFAVTAGPPNAVNTGGAAVANGGDLILASGSTNGQVRYVMMWPSGTHEHSADMTVAWYGAGGNCTVLVQGAVR